MPWKVNNTCILVGLLWFYGATWARQAELELETWRCWVAKEIKKSIMSACFPIQSWQTGSWTAEGQLWDGLLAKALDDHNSKGNVTCLAAKKRIERYHFNTCCVPNPCCTNGNVDLLLSGSSSRISPSYLSERRARTLHRTYQDLVRLGVPFVLALRTFGSFFHFEEAIGDKIHWVCILYHRCVIMIVAWVMHPYGVSMCSVELPIRFALLFKKYWLVVTKMSQMGRQTQAPDIQSYVRCPYQSSDA